MEDAAQYTQWLDEQVALHYGTVYVGQIQYYHTEFRTRGYPEPFEYPLRYIDTLFVPQYLLELARNGWSGANIWSLKNGFHSEDPATPYDYGLLKKGVGSDP